VESAELVESNDLVESEDLVEVEDLVGFEGVIGSERWREDWPKPCLSRRGRTFSVKAFW
jgi:hypothetical protein